jgi:hypothetical protein
MKVNNSTMQGHELLIPFTDMLSSVLLKWDETSINQQVSYYCKKRGKMSPDLAQKEMVKDKTIKCCIKNFALEPEPMEKELWKASKTIQEEDVRGASEANKTSKHYLRFYLPAQTNRKRKKLGTKDSMKNLLIHVVKGCCNDPLPVDEMNIALDPTNPHTIYWWCCSTLQGKKHHSLMNHLVDHIATQSADLAEAKMQLQVHEHNLEKEAKLSKVKGNGRIRKPNWFLNEALNQRFQ